MPVPSPACMKALLTVSCHKLVELCCGGVGSDHGLIQLYKLLKKQGTLIYFELEVPWNKVLQELTVHSKCIQTSPVM